MNTLFALIAGALLGTLIARRRNGVTLDYVHYAAVFALIFGIASIVIPMMIMRISG